MLVQQQQLQIVVLNEDTIEKKTNKRKEITSLRQRQ